MSDELTPRRTLESLKKEAKRWLAAIARGDANAIARLRHVIPAIGDTPTLRDIQLAIAREHGFAGWTELKLRLESSETEVRRGLASFDDEVNALLDAYRLGTPEAMKRHWSFTWHRRAWQGMRTYVQLDLGRQAGMPGFDAISHGFSTVATGGMSNHDNSFAGFSPSVQWIATVFMLLGAMSFSRFVQFARGEPRALFRDSQIRAFLTIYLCLAAVLFVARLVAGRAKSKGGGTPVPPPRLTQAASRKP